MTRGSTSSPLDPGATSAAPDIPPFSPLPPTATSSTTPSLRSHSPHPSEYRHSSTSDALNAERERRYKAEAELAITKAELANTREKLENAVDELDNTQAKLKIAEKDLEKLQSMSWASHMYRAAEDMGPGGALIATVGAPVMAAPLAVATVVKGIQGVGMGIGSLFSRRGRAGDAQDAAGAASAGSDTRA